MKNSIKANLAEEVQNLSHTELWDYWEKVRQEKKALDIVEKTIKDRLIIELGDNEQLALKGDAGVYWRTTTKYDVPFSDAEEVIQDQGMLHECLKVDLKKAKEVLPKDIYVKLEGKRVIVGEVKMLITGLVTDDK